MNHGTYAGYVAGCRQECCRSVARRYQKARVYDAHLGRSRMVDATGSRRRLRALHRMGWDWATLAARLGMDRRNVARFVACVQNVSRTRAERITAVYDELCMIPGPSDRARAWAERRGWPPPLCWDDDTIDDPAAKPVGMPTTTHKRVDVDDVAWLIRAGGTWDTVPTRFGVTREAVERALHRAGRRDLLDGLWRNTHGFEREGAA